MIQQPGDLDPPALALCLHLILIPDTDRPRSLGAIAIKLHLPLITGICRLRTRFKKTDRPQIFIKTKFFFCFHTYIGKSPTTNLRNYPGNTERIKATHLFKPAFVLLLPPPFLNKSSFTLLTGM